MAPTKFRPAQDSKGVGSKLDLNHLQSSQFLARPKANIPCEDSDTCIAISGKLKVVLCNYSLWLMFYSEQTEMILNKQGRRMFPFLAYKIHGMNPAAHYRVFLEIVPVDQQHWRYQNGKWCQCEEKENNVPGNRLYIHPDSPNTGAYWMKKEISFKKLKITNNMKAINNGNKMILLQSLRKYQPRLGIEEVRDGEHETPDSSSFIHNFTFPETEFITVTAYQNTKVSQLKINFNPFARGFRESYYPEENVNNFLASRDSTAMTTTSLETDSGGYPQELGERSYQAKEGAPLNPRLLTQATQLLLGGVYDSTPSRSSSLLSLDMNGMEHGLPLFTSPSTVYHHPRQDPVVPQGNWCLASSSNSTENSGGWLQSVPPVPMDTVTRAEKEKHLEEKFWTHTLSSESNDSRLNKGGLKRSLSPDDLEDEMCPKWKCRKQSDRCLTSLEFCASKISMQNASNSYTVGIGEGASQVLDGMPLTPGFLPQVSKEFMNFVYDSTHGNNNLQPLGRNDMNPYPLPSSCSPTIPFDPRQDVVDPLGDWSTFSSVNSNMNNGSWQQSVSPKPMNSFMKTQEEMDPENQLLNTLIQSFGSKCIEED